MPDRDAILRKAYQALAPNGKIVVIIDGSSSRCAFSQEFGYHHFAEHPHSVCSQHVLESIRTFGLKAKVIYNPYNIDTTGLLETEGSEELATVISFMVLDEFSNMTAERQQDMRMYINSSTRMVAGRRVWPMTEAFIVIEKTAHHNDSVAHNIGDYMHQDMYAEINNECWYSKYGLVPSVTYYLTIVARGKAIKDFGSARGDIS